MVRGDKQESADDEQWALWIAQEAWTRWKLTPKHKGLIADEIEAALANGIDREKILRAFDLNRGADARVLLGTMKRQRLRVPDVRPVDREPTGPRRPLTWPGKEEP